MSPTEERCATSTNTATAAVLEWMLAAKDDPAVAAKLGLGNPYRVARHEFALVTQNAKS